MYFIFGQEVPDFREETLREHLNYSTLKRLQVLFKTNNLTGHGGISLEFVEKLLEEKRQMN